LIGIEAEDFSVKDKGSKFPLPKPIEIATLAAILRPDSQPADAMKVAMEFYVEAVLFCQESSSLSFEDIVEKFGSGKRYVAFMTKGFKKWVEAQWADTLELDPQKDDDPVRQYLRERGLLLKRPQSVLDNFRCYYNASISKGVLRLSSRPSAENGIARCERITDGRKTYAIPKFMVDKIIRYAKWSRRESKRQSWRKRKSGKKPPYKNAQEES
jgi:hypothetical protein